MIEPPDEHATQLCNHWYWRPGWREGREFYTWHLTFTGQQDLHRLVSAYQDCLRDVPGLDLVPLEWLHLTVQGVGFVDEVSSGDVHAIAEAAAHELAEHPPIELVFHNPVLRPEALALPPSPTRPLIALRNAVRSGIAATWGADSVPETERQFDPHLSIAYANVDTSAARALTALDSIEAEAAHVPVRDLSLIALQRRGHLYRWQGVLNVELAATNEP